VNCLAACAKNDLACRNACTSVHPPAAQALANTLARCLFDAGASVCLP
jgi:hypothetical protein